MIKKKEEIKKVRTRSYFLCPVFGVSVCLNLGNRRPIIAFGAEHEPFKDSHAETTTLINDDDVEVGYNVWVKDKTDYHSMVHETLHLVVKIFDKKGIPFNAENHELIAYYQGYWVRKFWHTMSKFINDKKESDHVIKRNS